MSEGIVQETFTFYESSNRKVLLEYLGNHASPLRELYKNALFLINEKRFINDGIGPLICHACREIINSLPEYLAIVSSDEVQRVDLKKEILELQKGFSKISDNFLNNQSNEQGERSVYMEFKQLMAILQQNIEKKEKNHVGVKVKAERLFKHFVGDDQFQAENIEALKLWIDLQRWIQGNVHDKRDAAKKIDFGELCNKFEILEGLLFSLLANVLDNKDEIDAILGCANRTTN